ncbi:hypothetical protein RB595_001135 [Gaeumannomyces hyphopodioides]
MAEPSGAPAAWRAHRSRELGLQPIHLSIINNNLDHARQLLLADPRVTEARASDGTTPLMLAALFQRERAVRLLMKHRANIYARDHERKMAVEHCRINSFTDKKWLLYSQVSECVRSIDSSNKTHYKWAIGAINYPNGHTHLPQPFIHISYKSREIRFLVLVGEGRRGRLVPSSSRRHRLPDSLPDFWHVSQAGRFRAFKCLAEFMKPAGVNFGAPLTVGFLAVGRQLQLAKMAASGWSRTQDERMLDGATSTRLVRAFSKATGFVLDKNQRDNPGGRETDPHRLGQLEGLWCASHVEKKLAIYHLMQLMRKHLGQDFELQLQSGAPFDMGRLQELREANLAHEEVTILLGNVPCRNCHRFIKLVKRLTGVDIHLQPIAPLSDDEPVPAQGVEDEGDRRRTRPDNGDASSSTVDGDMDPQDTHTAERPHRTARGKGRMPPTLASSLRRPPPPATQEEYARCHQSSRESRWRTRSHCILGSPPKTAPSPNHVTLAVTTASRNAMTKIWSQARAQWQAEAPSGRGVSTIGRANSGREIRGSRHPGGQRGGHNIAVGRGLIGNDVAEPSRTGLPNLEEFRWSGSI